ncbi:MAG: hypothetical protein ACKVXR_07740 [Planctomycetota bacterium]
MSKIGSKVTWIAAGSAVFAVTFLGVSLLRGASMSEVPPFRWFAAPAPAADPEAKAAPASSPAQGAPSTSVASAPEEQPPAPSIVPTMTAGVLGTFVLPSPYDARELHDLDRRLKVRLAGIAAEEERLKRREQELADWQTLLQLRAAELADLRAALGDPSAPAGTAADAPGKGLTAATASSWRALAPLFAEGDPGEVSERLGQLAPEEAAQVLGGLDPERCAEILNAMPKERYKAFLDAWRRSLEIKR